MVWMEEERGGKVEGGVESGENVLWGRDVSVEGDSGREGGREFKVDLVGKEEKWME